ncbi:uncharacterized protein BJ212DRAFT_1256989 [Suillus subaureus]|uniref:Uncharacterized protein n=1 Tax=Suillus subaureus TaxID=48587 RepID=A0A9P7ENB6_9AGAM|nr:uncharacterized protein BJ212DRAFT_1256989 [Suillus subaureus]KAG1826818.1 hypothetical protein BJ212DRAFT_1256989 [Suillus subaureus]
MCAYALSHCIIASLKSDSSILSKATASPVLHPHWTVNRRQFSLRPAYVTTCN